MKKFEADGMVGTNESVPFMGDSDNQKKKVSPILVVLLVLATGATAYFYNVARALEQNPNRETELRVAALVAKVEKLITQPQGEIPTVVVITDASTLPKNPFFAKAKLGDKVLIYPISQKAFLYDPNANIIVEVASMSIGPR